MIRQVPVAADPGGLVLEADAALDLLLERLLHLGDELGRRDEIPELRADRVLVAVPGELAERVVDALGRDRAVALHGDEKARRRAADRREEVALRLDLVALRDELRQILAADQVAEVALAVDHPAHVGRDEDPPTVCRDPVGLAVQLLGALVHAPAEDPGALAVLLREEDVPPELAAHLLVVGEAEELLGARVESDDPALGVDQQEDHRRDVDDGPRERLLALHRFEAARELRPRAASAR